MLSENGGPVRSSLGVVVQTERLSGRAFDTLIIIGSEDASPKPTAGLLNFIRRGLKQSRRVTSICTGAFVLAEAGFLNGPPAPPPLDFPPEIPERFSQVKGGE